MGRRPTSQKAIDDSSKRRSTFKKRAASILKKIEELRTLTDCMVFFQAKFKDLDDVMVVKVNHPNQSGERLPEDSAELDRLSKELATMEVHDQQSQEESTDDDCEDAAQSTTPSTGESSDSQLGDIDLELLNELFPPNEQEPEPDCEGLKNCLSDQEFE